MKKWEIAKNKLLDPNWERPTRIRIREIIQNHRDNPEAVLYFYVPLLLFIPLAIWSIIIVFF